MTFDEALPLVRKICWKWARKYRLHDFDDFVNEIWLRCDFGKFTALKGEGVGRYIEYRIIDYIRDFYGRYGGQKGDGNRAICRLDPRAYEIVHEFGGFDAVDSDDSFEHLISRLCEKDRFIVGQYYRHGFTQLKIAEKLGLSESYISMRRTAALERLRAGLHKG